MCGRVVCAGGFCCGHCEGRVVDVSLAALVDDVWLVWCGD